MGESPLRAISDAWREDAGFRAAVEEDAKAALASKGLEIHGPAEVSVAVDTEDVTHFVFPPNPNETLSDTMLDGVSGGTFDWAGYVEETRHMRATACHGGCAAIPGRGIDAGGRRPGDRRGASLRASAAGFRRDGSRNRRSIRPTRPQTMFRRRFRRC